MYTPTVLYPDSDIYIFLILVISQVLPEID